MPQTTVTFKIEGLKEMEKAMLELGAAASTRIADAGLRAGTGVIIERARQLVPVRSGATKKAITRRRVRRRQPPGARRWIMGVEKPQSHVFRFLELGTARMAARPFMRPAMDEKAAEALMKMAEAMTAAIAKEAERLPKVKPRRWLP